MGTYQLLGRLFSLINRMGKLTCENWIFVNNCSYILQLVLTGAIVAIYYN